MKKLLLVLALLAELNPFAHAQKIEVINSTTGVKKAVTMSGGATITVDGVVTNATATAATTAATLATPRTIFGQSFNGSANIGGGAITLAGNLITTGAFNTTFAQAASVTITLPVTSATMARTDAAQTFNGLQTIVSAVGTAGCLTLNGSADRYTLLRFNGGDRVWQFGSDNAAHTWYLYDETAGVTVISAAAGGVVTIDKTLICNSPIRRKGYTVATLPAGTQGDSAFVTDALAPTFLGALTGGGSVVTPVFYNGTAWVAD